MIRHEVEEKFDMTKTCSADNRHPTGRFCGGRDWITRSDRPYHIEILDCQCIKNVSLLPVVYDATIIAHYRSMRSATCLFLSTPYE
jgi:hypothetical protein